VKREDGLGDLSVDWRHNTKFKLTELGCDNVDWLDMTQNSTQRSYKYNNEMLRSIKVVEFLD
jgi:hypothetical protein